MMRILATALGAISVFWQPSASAAAEPVRVRVLTYNIHHGEGVDGRLDLARIAEVIRAAEPNLVALQEVDQNTRRTGGVDQPAELARLTGMHVQYGKNIDLEGGGYGNAVLSKRRIKQIENLQLPSLQHDPNLDDREQRGALIVGVENPGGQALVFIATHLDARRPDAERLASMKLIGESVTARFRDQPAILAGDLNATPTSDVLTLARDLWHDPAGELPTTPVGKPRRQIDFILVRPASQWRMLEARVLDEAVASDHRPLLLELELVPEG